nr:MAG TPA: hypothetical protein [Caudoviricetes sp.]
MRKLILNLFALSYRAKIFGTLIPQLRASVIIFPLFLLMMISFFINSMILKFISIPLLIVAIFYGFVYFRIFPIQEEDLKYLDKSQLNQYNMYNNLEEYNNEDDSILYLLINPIIIVIFLILMII